VLTRPISQSYHPHHDLFVAGTGYSIAGSESDIPQDMQGMAEDLYSGLWQFFDQHKELQHRPFFITGESYAGEDIWP